MRQKNKEIFLLVILITLLFFINYSWIDLALFNLFDEQDSGIVERVIDGDTLVIKGNSFRLLGVNSPERGEKYYDESKTFLEKLVLNKTVRLEYGKDKKDLYNRTLSYIFINEKNINLDLVRNGFANFYFPSGKDAYYKKFKLAWEDCIKEDKNLCKSSEEECFHCIELKNFDYENQEIIFYNKCDFNCELTNWKIKDEGRKNFIFPIFILNSEEEVKIKVDKEEDSKSVLFWKDQAYVWTKTGDTLFLKDKQDNLVLWETY